MRRKWQIIIGIILIAFFILIAFAAPVLAPNDPNATNLAMKNAEPSAEYPLGCVHDSMVFEDGALLCKNRVRQGIHRGSKDFRGFQYPHCCYALNTKCIATIHCIFYNGDCISHYFYFWICFFGCRSGKGYIRVGRNVK